MNKYLSIASPSLHTVEGQIYEFHIEMLSAILTLVVQSLHNNGWTSAQQSPDPKPARQSHIMGRKSEKKIEARSHACGCHRNSNGIGRKGLGCGHSNPRHCLERCQQSQAPGYSGPCRTEACTLKQLERATKSVHSIADA